jgi:hypothetical protein
VKWLYSQKAPTFPDEVLCEEIRNRGGNSGESIEVQKAQYLLNNHTLAQLWVLADRFLVRPLQNVVNDRIHARMYAIRPSMVITGTLDYIYQKTAKGSLLRRLVLEDLTWEMEPDTMAQCLKLIPQEMVHELVVYLMVTIE